MDTRPGDEASGKRKWGFKQLRSRLIGRLRRKGVKPGAVKQSQSVGDVTSDVTGASVACDSDDDQLSSIALVSRAMSHDSIFQTDQSQSLTEPARVQSQENMEGGKVRALQLKLRQQKMHLGPPPLFLPPTKRMEDSTATSEDDGLPHSPLAQEPPYKDRSSLSLKGTGSEEEDQWSSRSSSCLLSLPDAASSGVDLDGPARFSGLNTSAARHRLSIKPRNQRGGTRNRKPTQASSRPPSETLSEEEMILTEREEERREEVKEEERRESGGDAPTQSQTQARAEEKRWSLTPPAGGREVVQSLKPDLPADPLESRTSKTTRQATMGSTTKSTTCTTMGSATKSSTCSTTEPTTKSTTCTTMGSTTKSTTCTTTEPTAKSTTCTTMGSTTKSTTCTTMGSATKSTTCTTIWSTTKSTTCTTTEPTTKSTSCTTMGSTTKSAFKTTTKATMTCTTKTSTQTIDPITRSTSQPTPDPHLPAPGGRRGRGGGGGATMSDSSSLMKRKQVRKMEDRGREQEGAGKMKEKEDGGREKKEEDEAEGEAEGGFGIGGNMEQREEGGGIEKKDEEDMERRKGTFGVKLRPTSLSLRQRSKMAQSDLTVKRHSVEVMASREDTQPVRKDDGQRSKSREEFVANQLLRKSALSRTLTPPTVDLRGQQEVNKRSSIQSPLPCPEREPRPGVERLPRQPPPPQPPALLRKNQDVRPTCPSSSSSYLLLSSQPSPQATPEPPLPPSSSSSLSSSAAAATVSPSWMELANRKSRAWSDKTVD